MRACTRLCNMCIGACARAAYGAHAHALRKNGALRHALSVRMSPARAAVKFGWRLAWQVMVRELAPQTKDGQYSRPQYAFDEVIGTGEFPVGACLPARLQGSRLITLHRHCHLP